jgi:hypothetical protein
MARGTHQRRHRRGAVAATVAAVAVLAVLAVGAEVVGTAPAKATGSSGGGKTVRTVLNIPAMVLDNLCNADVVNLSGDLVITTTTTPDRRGGYTVRTSANAFGLRGSRIAPPPAVGYRGDDSENTYSYYAPPPYPSTHRVVHWTRLVPQAAAPTMYLVLVVRETILADGTVVPVFERAYLVCTQPRCSNQRV